ncbi:ABC transporter permease [Bradyrhizobium sp. 61]|uniref:ABC transporter permease n=1 Tax=unclassified Bradyrhizobium TaxID=2631580 RepID=UPI001FF9467C|nr:MULTISPECIES: ABC transporter permease [unclassified Bradyrhizobium]MCK1274683.1 ABC transporter permease [Bradyrhizobium sp. 61]MCK1441677.1 ABC transporter permease [Bradyrhizobium sp. 48]MCK1465219.1 ABC transporter permease [Bradyrhizobium sp. 2]
MSSTSVVRAVLSSPAGIAGSLVIIGVLATATLAPLLYPGDPSDMVASPFIWPGSDPEFPLGTDLMGRDLTAGLFHGASVSLMVGAVAAAIALAIGVSLGAIAGYYGGWMDDLIMRVTELFQTMPAFLLAIVMVAVLNPSIYTIILALGITAWPGIARLTRAEVLALRNRDFVQALIGMGMSDWRIVLFHVVPNALTPVIVAASILVATAILSEAGLSFLGLGDPNHVSWGTMIGAGRDALRTAWYQTAIPGLAIMITVLALNLLGDALNHALNPRLRP